MKNRKISDAQQKYYCEAEKESAKRYVEKYEKYLGRFIDSDKVVIIDIGGASGYFANEIIEFYKHTNTNAVVTVIDYCKYDEWHLFNNINFIAESVFTALTRIPDSSADIIFMNLMLHHLTMATYKETREAQRNLLKIVHAKIKQNGYVCINECYYQNPILRDISIPFVYFMSSSNLPVMIKISKKLGSKSASIGVCFLSTNVWLETFAEIGFSIIELQENPWRWIKMFLIREKFFRFILSK